MKKTIIIFLIAIMAISCAYAQNTENNKFLNLGMMIPLKEKSYTLNPIDLSFEYVFFKKNNFSIGGEAGIYYGIADINLQKVNFGAFHLKPLFHYNFTDNFDIFTGYGLYIPFNDEKDYKTTLKGQFTIGARYFILESLGVYSRYHYDYNFLELGVSYRF